MGKKSKIILLKLYNMERLISDLISSAREVEELLEFNCVEEDDKDLFKLQRLLDDAVSLAEGLNHKKNRKNIRVMSLEAKIFLDNKQEEHFKQFGVYADVNSKLAEWMQEYKDKTK